MANQSVLELAVGVGKWDAGLKKAKSALDKFTDANGGLQQALDKESAKMGKFVQMMGKMDSTAKTAKGQMNEYKSTIEQLTMQYNRMTDAQKKSIGQDYLQAVDQLKLKYQAVNDEIQEMNRSLSQRSSSASAASTTIGSTDGINAGGFGGGKFDGALQVFAGNMMTKAAGWAAGFVSELGDAVKQGIELAKQGEGIRIAFERLGRGDILQGLRDATHGTVTDLELMKAAVKFSDFKLPVEELGTMLAFAQQKAKDTGQSVDYMVDSIVTGLGRKSLMILDNLGLSANEIKEKMKDTGDMTKAVGAIIREQMAKAGDYVETASDRATKANVELENAMESLGRTFQPLTDAGSSMWNSLKVGALDLLNSAVRPLIDALTEAGRIRSQYEEQGGNTRVNRMLGTLKGIHSSQYRKNTYNAQVGNFDKSINEYQQYLDDYRKWEKGKRTNNIEVGAYDRMEEFKKSHKLDNYMFSTVKEQLEVFKRERAEYVMGAKSILNDMPSPSPTDRGITTNTTKGSGITTNTTKGSGVEGGKSITVQTEYQQNQSKINTLTQEYVTLSDQSTEAARARLEAIRAEILTLEKRNDVLKLYEEQAHGKMLGGKVETSGLSVANNGLNDQSQQSTISFGGFASMEGIGSGLDPKTMEYINQLTYGGKKAASSWKEAATAVTAVGSALQNVQDPSVKVFGIIAEAIANIAGGFAAATNKTGKEGNVWTWIAATVSGLATMTATIAAIRSATGYATGGKVDGNTFSGDQIPIMANAGEVILNQAQQNNVASALQEGGGRELNIVGHLSGEDIILVANRTFRRKGQGEIVTW